MTRTTCTFGWLLHCFYSTCCLSASAGCPLVCWSALLPLLRCLLLLLMFPCWLAGRWQRWRPLLQLLGLQ
jgi:hypothetical protein